MALVRAGSKESMIPVLKTKLTQLQTHKPLI